MELLAGKNARPATKEVAMKLERHRTYKQLSYPDQARQSLAQYFLLRQQSESHIVNSIGRDGIRGHVLFDFMYRKLSCVRTNFVVND